MGPGGTQGAPQGRSRGGPKEPRGRPTNRGSPPWTQQGSPKGPKVVKGGQGDPKEGPEGVRRQAIESLGNLV